MAKTIIKHRDQKSKKLLNLLKFIIFPLAYPFQIKTIPRDLFQKGTRNFHWLHMVSLIGLLGQGYSLKGILFLPKRKIGFSQFPLTLNQKDSYFPILLDLF